MVQDTNRPKGVPFFNVKSGETNYARSSAQIQAYINSSDMGINASRDQDFGWKLAADWVKKVKAFRRDESKMDALSTKFGGNKPSTPQILTTIYRSQVRAHRQRQEDEEAPFEQQYQRDISEAPQVQPPEPMPQAEPEEAPKKKATKK